jgi:hypothetical protein
MQWIGPKAERLVKKGSPTDCEMFKFEVEQRGGDAVPTVVVIEEMDEGFVT